MPGHPLSAGAVSKRFVPPNLPPIGTPRSSRQSIVEVRRWTPALVSLRVTRDPAFRFAPGHFARVGLVGAAGDAVVRPLSIASAPDDPHLEFLCSRVEGGAFSARLAGCRTGDAVQLETASFGFLTVDSLAPGRDLWLLATGTGLAPFVSMLRDPVACAGFERIVVAHSVRHAAELGPAGELRGRERVRYLPIVTREPGATALCARIPILLGDGRLAAAAGVELDVARSRVMACGNPAMATEVRALLSARGFRTSRRGVPGQMAFETYWQPAT